MLSSLRPVLRPYLDGYQDVIRAAVTRMRSLMLGSRRSMTGRVSRLGRVISLISCIRFSMAASVSSSTTHHHTAQQLPHTPPHCSTTACTTILLNNCAQHRPVFSFLQHTTAVCNSHTAQQLPHTPPHCSTTACTTILLNNCAQHRSVFSSLQHTTAVCNSHAQYRRVNEQTPQSCSKCSIWTCIANRKFVL